MIDKAKKPKVLMIGPGREVRGGISTVVNSYFELGLDQKNDLTYLTTMEDGSKLKKLMVAICSYFRFSLMLKKYDIVHVHMAAQASFFRKALFVKNAHKAGKKIIIHQHAADFDEFYHQQCDEEKRSKIKRIFQMADKVIVLSDSWANFFGKFVCDEKKLIVLYNGVIMPDYEKVDYSDKNVLFLGRLGKRKGTYDLIGIIPDLLKEVPDAMFYLGGDGDVEECERIIQKQGTNKNVKFLGWVRDKQKEEYLKQCSIFVLPSYHEGMPMSVLEAMSYGLATISTNAGGIPQIIDNNVDGIRIEAGDLQSLSENLKNLLLDKSLRTKLGQAGKIKIANSFNVKNNIEQLCQIYFKLEEIS